MKYSTYSCIAIICLSLSSCFLTSENNKQIVKNFGKTDTLRGKPIITLVPPQAPYQIFISGDKLVSVECQSSSDIFRVYKIPSFEYLYTWGSIPKNLSQPDFFSTATTEEGFRLWDHGDKILKYFSVTDDSINLVKQELVGLMWSPITGLTFLSDSIFIAENPIVDNDLPFEQVGLNHYAGDRIIKRFGTFPNLDPGINSPGLVRAFKKVYIKKPDGSKFIAMYQYYKWFKLYDNNFNLIKEVALDAEPTLNKDRTLQFVQGFGTENFIYILCFNKKSDDILNDIEALSPVLTIWDWEGKPVGRYQLDKPIISITVSEPLKKIYGSSLLQPKLFEFDLPDVDAVTLANMQP